MTAKQLQDPVSTPVTAHLTPVQRALFNQAVSAYLTARASEAKMEAEFGVEIRSKGTKLVFSGDASGQLQYVRADDIRFGDAAEVRLALLHVQGSLGDQPSVHFMAATVTEANGSAEVSSLQVLDLAELFSRVIEVEYRYNNTGCRGACPLSGEVFKPFIGDYPFLAGTWDPVFEGCLPPAGPENLDPSRARWTVGEVQAYMVSQWHAVQAARNNPALPAVVGSDVDNPF